MASDRIPCCMGSAARDDCTCRHGPPASRLAAAGISAADIAAEVERLTAALADNEAAYVKSMTRAARMQARAKAAESALAVMESRALAAESALARVRAVADVLDHEAHVAVMGALDGDR